MTTLHKTIVVTAAVLSVGGAVFETHQLRAQRTELAAGLARVDTLAREAKDVRAQRTAALRRLEEARQRAGSVGIHAPAADAPEEIEAEMNAWLDRVERVKALRAQRPELVVPELRMLPDETLLEVARDVRLDSEEDVLEVFAKLRHRAEGNFVSATQRALRAYVKARDGHLPANWSELWPFYDIALEAAAFDRYKLVAAGEKAEQPRRDATIVELTKPLDWRRDSTWRFSLTGLTSGPALGTYVREALRAYSAANNGARPTQPEHLQAFLPSPVDPARLRPYLNPSR